MAARDDFLLRIAAVERLLNDSTALTLLGHSLSDTQRNEQARLLRNGLAVTSFALLEDFLITRTGELLAAVSQSSLPFVKLPQHLQELTTRKVVSALKFQVDLSARRGADPTALIWTTAQALASTAGYPYHLSELAFGNSRSNLGHADIKELLGVFNVKDGWGVLTNLAKRMGFAGLSLKDDFSQATNRRNTAAHVASTETPLGDLRGFARQVLGVAAAFDGIATRAVYRLRVGDAAFARGDIPLDDGEIELRFLEKEGSTFRDVRETAKKAALRSPNRSAVLSACRYRARKTGAIVVYRAHGVPDGWECTDLSPGRP